MNAARHPCATQLAAVHSTRSHLSTHPLSRCCCACAVDRARANVLPAVCAIARKSPIDCYPGWCRRWLTHLDCRWVRRLPVRRGRYTIYRPYAARGRFPQPTIRCSMSPSFQLPWPPREYRKRVRQDRCRPRHCSTAARRTTEIRSAARSTKLALFSCVYDYCIGAFRQSLSAPHTFMSGNSPC